MPCAAIPGMVRNPRRGEAFPLLTFIAPLRNASQPLSNSPRVGVLIGATWKSMRRMLSPPQTIEVRCPDDRIAAAGKLAVALIVGNDDGDVRWLRDRAGHRSEKAQQAGEETENDVSATLRWPLAMRQPTFWSGGRAAVLRVAGEFPIYEVEARPYSADVLQSREERGSSRASLQ